LKTRKKTPGPRKEVPSRDKTLVRKHHQKHKNYSKQPKHIECLHREGKPFLQKLAEPANNHGKKEVHGRDPKVRTHSIKTTVQSENPS